MKMRFQDNGNFVYKLLPRISFEIPGELCKKVPERELFVYRNFFVTSAHSKSQKSKNFQNLLTVKSLYTLHLPYKSLRR